MSFDISGLSVNDIVGAGGKNVLASRVAAAVCMGDGSLPFGEYVKQGQQMLAQEQACQALQGVNIPGLQIANATEIGSAIGGVASQDKSSGLVV